MAKVEEEKRDGRGVRVSYALEKRSGGRRPWDMRWTLYFFIVNTCYLTNERDLYD